MHVCHTSVATDSTNAKWRCTANGPDYMLGDEFKASQSPMWATYELGK